MRVDIHTCTYTDYTLPFLTPPSVAFGPLEKVQKLGLGKGGAGVNQATLFCFVGLRVLCPTPENQQADPAALYGEP